MSPYFSNRTHTSLSSTRCPSTHSQLLTQFTNDSDHSPLNRLPTILRSLRSARRVALALSTFSPTCPRYKNIPSRERYHHHLSRTFFFSIQIRNQQFHVLCSQFSAHCSVHFSYCQELHAFASKTARTSSYKT